VGGARCDRRPAQGGGLGPINTALYKIGADPTRYANDFFDITLGNNQTVSTVAGYPATTGWDPVTGLGTPNAANLVPDLVSARARALGTNEFRATQGAAPRRASFAAML